MTTNYHTAVSTGAAANASTINSPLGQLDSTITTILSGGTAFSQINVGTDTTLTISSGAITVSKTRHLVDTEGSASSDDLTDISGGSEGDILILQCANASRAVVVKHNASKIFLAQQADITLNNVYMALPLLNVGSNVWVQIQTPPAAIPYVKVADIKSKSTHGGAASAGWQTRVLNTEVTDTAGIATLSSNQVTLPAGTYDCFITAPAHKVDQHHAVLWNDTDSSLVISGSSEHSANTDAIQTTSVIRGQFTLAASKALTVRHYATNASSSYLGVATNANDPGGTSMDEVYTVAEFWKVG